MNRRKIFAVLLGLVAGIFARGKKAEASAKPKVYPKEFAALKKRAQIFEDYDVPTMMSDATIDAVNGFPQLHEYLKFFRDAIESIDDRFKRS